MIGARSHLGHRSSGVPSAGERMMGMMPPNLAFVADGPVPKHFRDAALGVGFAIAAVCAALRFSIYAGLATWSESYLPGRVLALFAIAAGLAGLAYASAAFFRHPLSPDFRLRLAASALAMSYVLALGSVLTFDVAGSSELPVSPGGVPYYLQTASYLPLALAAALAAVGFGRSGSQRYTLLSWSGAGFALSYLMLVPYALRGIHVGRSLLAFLALVVLVIGGILLADSSARLARGFLRADRAERRRLDLILCVTGGAYLVYGLATTGLWYWDVAPLSAGWTEVVSSWFYQISQLSPLVLGLSVFLAFLVPWNAARISCSRGSREK